MTRSAKLLSAWITVAITVERLIAVLYPLRVAILSTTKRARLVVGFLTIASLSLAAFPLWTVATRQFHRMPTCIRLERSSYKWWLVGVVVVLTLTLPCSLLIICTTLIVIRLIRSKHFRRNNVRTHFTVVAIRSSSRHQHNTHRVAQKSKPLPNDQKIVLNRTKTCE